MDNDQEVTAEESDAVRQPGSSVCDKHVKSDSGECSDDCRYIVPAGGDCPNAANHCD